MKCNFNEIKEIVLQLYWNHTWLGFFRFSLISMKFFWVAVFSENFWDAISENTWPDLFLKLDYTLALANKGAHTFKYYWFDLRLESPQSLSFIFLFFADTNFEVLNKSLYDLCWLALLLYKDCSKSPPPDKYINSFQLALHAHFWINIFFGPLR